MSKSMIQILVLSAKAGGYNDAEIVEIDTKEKLPHGFYHHVMTWTEGFYLKDFCIKGTTGEIEIYNADLILERQAGYEFAGKDKNNKVPEWKSNWLVIGDMASDPLILDLHSGAILGAQHGIGEWSPIKLCNNFEELIKILDIWIDVYIKEYNGRSHNDDFSINNEFTSKLKDLFSKITTEELVENIMNFYDLEEG